MDLSRELASPGKHESHKGHKHFVLDPYTDALIRELRNKHVASLLSEKAPRLNADESLSLILAGNAEHVLALKNSPKTPRERHVQIINGEADYLVVGCSDSRILRLDSEKDNLVGTFIRIAGNVVPKKGTPSFYEMKEAVSMVRKDGAIIFEGHDGGPGCGAVNERVKWIESGMPHTGSKPLDTLLHCVFGESPEQNAVAQLTVGRETLGIGERPSAAIIYDWDHSKHGHDEPIHIVSANHSEIIEILRDNWNRKHASAKEEGNLGKKLQNQRPHAIAVGSFDLPFSVGTILHADQNEVFSTTGSDQGLDDLDMASILYAIEHLHIRHIPFIAPASSGEEKKPRQMFDLWEKQLRGMEVHGEPLIAQMLDEGTIRITRLVYDLDSGKLVKI